LAAGTVDGKKQGMENSLSVSGPPAALPPPGRWWFRFPAGVLRNGPQGDLWIARALWLLALPAQYVVLQYYLQGTNIQEVILFSLFCLMIISLLGTLFQLSGLRVGNVSLGEVNFRESITLCWILSTVLYAIILQFSDFTQNYLSFYISPYVLSDSISTQSDAIKWLSCALISSVSLLGIDPTLYCTETPNITLFLIIHLICAFLACIVTVLGVAALRKFSPLKDLSISPAADPPVLLVWLMTGVVLALVYYVSLSHWR
jgi:hypothetical protein